MFAEFRHKLKTQRLFCTVYVLGTALSVASVMLLVIFLHIRLSPVYPEVNRPDTYILDDAVWLEEDHNENESGCLTNAFTDSLRAMLGPDAIISSTHPEFYYENYEYFTADIDRPDFPIQIVTRFTDTDFFRIYEFEFLEGAPFTEADLSSGLRRAVITDRLARRLFGTDSGVVGREFPLNRATFTVAGVVREGSVLCKASFAQVYMPFTSMFESRKKVECCVGNNCLTILTHDRGKLEAAVDELVRRHDSAVSDGHRLWLRSGITTGVTHLVMPLFALLIALFLVVPSLNLSGLIAGDMDTRLAEMGIRKTFGARRGRLLRRIILDNVALSTIGGFIGLALAWVGMSSWAWRFTSSNRLPSVDVTVNPDMLFSFGIFAAAFLFCLLVNVASSLIPAWWSLRKPAVMALNENKR
ncbi:MAG: ABC transporter permease [Muribaculaceae bacterium]|nr:ABC transporter permease [Muribaculaceae bacterium]MDE6461430.1 ABC transporter permease [Muribaculaceae bacterium]MDE7143512.1 ABC transporter permease [Muribaculaceae bacterium]